MKRISSSVLRLSSIVFFVLISSCGGGGGGTAIVPPAPHVYQGVYVAGLGDKNGTISFTKQSKTTLSGLASMESPSTTVLFVGISEGPYDKTSNKDMWLYYTGGNDDIVEAGIWVRFEMDRACGTNPMDPNWSFQSGVWMLPGKTAAMSTVQLGNFMDCPGFEVGTHAMTITSYRDAARLDLFDTHEIQFEIGP